MTCVREALRSKLGWGAVVVGAVAGMFVWYVLPGILSAREGVATRLMDTSVEVVSADRPNYAIKVRLEVLISNQCRRQTFFSLVDDAKKDIWLLGSQASGAGFSPPWAGSYSNGMPVAPSIPSGTYRLVWRSVFECSWPPVRDDVDPLPDGERNSFQISLLRWSVIKQGQMGNVIIP